MHEFLCSGISFQHYAIFDRKSDFKKNLKTGFQNRKPVFKIENRFSKSKTSFQNRKPVFGFQINIPNMYILLLRLFRLTM